MGVSQYLMVSSRCPTWDQNSIFFLEIDPIPFLGLDLIDPRSSYYIITPCRMLFENENSAVKDKDQKLQKLNDWIRPHACLCRNKVKYKLSKSGPVVRLLLGMLGECRSEGLETNPATWSTIFGAKVFMIKNSIFRRVSFIKSNATIM